jgi:hypothetical protein
MGKKSKSMLEQIGDAVSAGAGGLRRRGEQRGANRRRSAADRSDESQAQVRS